MRRIAVLCLILSLVLPAVLLAGPHPWERKLPFKQATIHYSISGSETGSQTLYIKDQGKYTSQHKKSATRMFGMSQPEQETLEIKTPEWVYSVDLKARTASQSVNPEVFMIEEFGRLSAAEQKKALANAEKFGRSTLNSLGGEVQRKAATLLGYPCDVVRVMGTENYSIADSDITLKTVVSMMGMNTRIEATRIDTGSVPEDKFRVPAGIPVTRTTEGDALMRDNARMAVQMLVSGQQPTVQLMAPAAAAQAMENDTDDAGDDEMPSAEEMQAILKMFGGQQK